MTRKVAMAGFLHETNTFAPTRAQMSDFEQGGGYMPMARGADVLNRGRGINLGIGGAVLHGESAGWDMVPLVWAGAIPSAHVAQDAYDTITDEIVQALRDAGPVDGVFLDLHGAMVAEHVDDGEGDFLARVREVVGPDVPIACALDLHGNITQKMVDAADVLVGFRTYPHVDMGETGRRAAVQLDRLMERGAPFAKAFRRIPFLVPIAWQSTRAEPARGLYDLVSGLEEGGVSSTSFFFGFPAADFPGCGPTVICYGDTQADADAAADSIEAAVLAAEADFAGKTYDPDSGVKEAMRLSQTASKPIVIADTQDNPGAGGDSNTTGMLRAMVANNAHGAMGNMVDPKAAAAAHAAGQGAEIEIELGGFSGVAGDAPFAGRFTVETLSDGHLVATGPFYGGAPLDMGPSACLRIGDVRVVVTTNKAQMADQEMYRFVGIEPTEQPILVNKSSVHFRADFDSIAETILTCVAPGPMPVSPASLPFTRLAPGMRLEPLGAVFDPEKSTGGAATQTA
ncbi:M81 family metallopeptidase [Lutimaribacter sp. EGI FJ00015]|uniref:M81 family metallopeptidase n=1 Tax=Lutimaribacter degradans TaxID=2945989 RepID=A0ACC5ZTE9_9RHOB|nr:M81 family metallopeptidase [Lutimaribacter sp. EGI FJ00013]MCM2561316.1 M81 family metallopeptidase [Lutimaribacter sp. EGI FJ00013]MCO0611733.1 M81 family metallopeptidase [Lutimaribacter sp. EGI FJ00015]MCO0635145.1 M81 family metallopeptidase [Lutimaribacter sp. EGI FJ00014]